MFWNRRPDKSLSGGEQVFFEIFSTDSHFRFQILEKGELQISDKERQSQQEATLKEIATIIADKTVNPETKRPYPVSMIEKSMKQVHFSLKPKRTAKQQALETIAKLKDVIPIEKSQMKLRVICHKKHLKQLKEMAAEVESENISGDGVLEMVFLSDPGHYRAIDLLIKDSPKAQLHVLSLREVVDGDESLGFDSNSSSSKRKDPGLEAL